MSFHQNRCLYCSLVAVSVEACRRNIKFNGSVASSKVDSQLADARVYMLTHPKEFDVVLSLSLSLSFPLFFSCENTCAKYIYIPACLYLILFGE